jgi:hypothetical protein
VFNEPLSYVLVLYFFQCIPFWPENLSGKLCVRVVGYEGSSKPFFYNRQDNGTLLSLEDLVSLQIAKYHVFDF